MEQETAEDRIEVEIEIEQDTEIEKTLPSPLPVPPSQVITIEKEFITSLESLPLLWDKTHILYTNKYKRNEALEKLRKILLKLKPQAGIEDVKKKINVLRSNYRRELKKIISSRRSGSGADELYRPKSWTFDYLKFLEKCEQPVPVDQKLHEIYSDLS